MLGYLAAERGGHLIEVSARGAARVREDRWIAGGWIQVVLRLDGFVPVDAVDTSGGGRVDTDVGGYTIEDVTINVCTVNRPDFLEACLQSLLDTTPEGARLQIVFNGTPNWIRDRTIDQARRWKGPVEFVHIEETVPLDESHNIALAGIDTRLVNFMGDDDVVLAPRLETLLAAFNSVLPEPVVVTSFARRIAGDAFRPSIGSNKDLGPTSVAEWRAWHDSGAVFEMLWPGAILRTADLRAIGGFEAAFNQSADNRIFSQLSFRGPVLSVPDRSFGYRIHQGSLSSANWKVQNHHVRYVEACHAANLAGEREPSVEEFLSSESALPVQARIGRGLRDRSRIMFRKGGEMVLSGQRIGGAAHLAASAMLWPPSFAEKLMDQIGDRRF